MPSQVCRASYLSCGAMPANGRKVSRLLALTCFAPAYQLLREVQTSSTRLKATLETSQEAYQLIKWIKDGGGHCESVQIAFDRKSGQTLVTTQAISKGKLVISLPRSCQLLAESSDPALQSLIEQVPTDLWAARLALPVVAERTKGTQSRFLPYLSSLPAGIGGLPVFFRPEEIKRLQYPPLIQQINLRCRWLLKFASDQLAAGTADDPFNGVTIDANVLGWGMGIASSRAFKVGKNKQPSLLPLIDLCNHSFEPNCALESLQDGTARLVASQDIPADKPLAINYGELSNTTLLQDYGFIVPNNPHDSVEMTLSTDQIQVAQILGGVGMPEDLQPWQMSLLGKLGALDAGSSVQLSRREPMFDWRLISAVRVLCAAEEQDLGGRDVAQLGDLEWPLAAAAAERRSLRTLAAMCAQLIAAMGTKLEDDRRLLSGHTALSPNSKLAIHYSVQLKEFIQAALALVLNKLKAIS